MTNEQRIALLEKRVAELEEKVAEATTTVNLSMDGRTVARALAPDISEELNRLSAIRQRHAGLNQ